MTMGLEQPFSKRHHFAGSKEIIIREDAPENLRYFVVQITFDLGWQPGTFRDVLCRVLRVSPDARSEWRRQILHEINSLISGCEWFKVYDLIVALNARLAQGDEYSGEDNAGVFTREINEFFLDEGMAGRLSMEKSSRAVLRRLKP